MKSLPAVLLLGHKRPDLAREVFERIREAKPAKFYLAVDGARSADEEADCRRVRELAARVDWPCDVRTLFQEQNLGCRRAVFTAISWFFEQELEGIILEEDCVPDPSFFEFCREGLERFRGCRRVGWISGFKPGPGPERAQAFFQTWTGSPWGWATWREIWQEHRADPDAGIPDWDHIGLRKWLNGSSAVRLWETRRKAVEAGWVNSWFFPWQIHLIKHQRMVLMPAVNLVVNKGIGSDATHTRDHRYIPEALPHPLPFLLPDSHAPDRESEHRELLACLGEISLPAEDLHAAVREVVGGVFHLHELLSTSREIEGHCPQVATRPQGFKALVSSVARRLAQRVLRERNSAVAAKVRIAASRLAQIIEPLALQADHKSRGRFLYASLAYGQEGEDLVLDRVFAGKADGFFIDVGAHHPFRFSNTQRLYEKGWSGINIEPTPGFIDDFRVWRPRDINLPIAAGSKRGFLELHVFAEGAYNTLSAELAKSRLESGKGEGHRIVTVPVLPLSEVCEAHVPSDKPIDLLTVDTEGYDLDVLCGMDWSRNLPRIIICESLGDNDLSKAVAIPVVGFLVARGYRLFAATFNSLFFERSDPCLISAKGGGSG